MVRPAQRREVVVWARTAYQHSERMRSNSRLWPVIALVGFCLPRPARGCSCPTEKPAPEALADATVVFRGVITTVERAEPEWRSWESLGLVHRKGQSIRSMQLTADFGAC